MEKLPFPVNNWYSCSVPQVPKHDKPATNANVERVVARLAVALHELA